MRLISVRTSDRHDALGVTDGTSWLPATDLVPGAPPTMAALLEAGPDGLHDLRAAADPGRITGLGRPLGEASLRAPVPRPGKVVAIGRNYRDHTTEEGVAAPAAPLVFAKWASCVIGPDEPIRWDAELTQAVDYAAELAVVIGRTARHVRAADALDHVLGYTCLNDVTARDLQFGDGQWTRGKSLDTFCPMGPVLVTTDELPDPGSLAITCRVDGEVVQQATTADMFFGVAAIIEHCSAAFTLEPGDVIATGTPGGVGWFREPRRLLADGAVVEVEIEGIGRLSNPCRVDALVRAS
jgi:5-carboxymethyl-2-hydroxymuconate isomerase